MLDAGIHPDGDFRPHDDGDIGPAEQSLWRMAKRFEADASLAFCVLTGDQIYVDATAGLFDANTLLDGLTVAYTGLTASRGMARLRLYARAQHPPEVVTLMDDHEVADNWEPLPASFGIPPDAKQQLIKTAKKRYLEYQRSNWPPPAHITGHPLFESRTLSGFEFFLADTRTERAGRWVGNWDIAEIMGPAQALALKQWIKTIANLDTPSFIVSPSILLPRLLCTQDRPPMALHADSWCGYPKSLYNVLASAYCANARRLVFLSGDEHLSCLARIEVSCSEEPGRVVTLHSIHSSALYAPFPFANAIEQDFAGSDKIEFTHTCDDGAERHFRCVVSTYFSAVGDGFALIRMSKESGEWCGNVKFDGQKGPTEELRFA